MSECRCVAHPKKKHRYVISKYIDYAADMNVLMTYYKCMDDWNDEKKFLKVVYGKLLKKKEKSIALRYEEKTNIILENLASLYMAEKAQSQDLDEVSGYFGKICEAIFEYKNDEYRNISQERIVDRDARFMDAGKMAAFVEENFSDCWNVVALRNAQYYQTQILEQQSEFGGMRLVFEEEKLVCIYAYAKGKIMIKILFVCLLNILVIVTYIH